MRHKNYLSLHHQVAHSSCLDSAIISKVVLVPDEVGRVVHFCMHLNRSVCQTYHETFFNHSAYSLAVLSPVIGYCLYLVELLLKIDDLSTLIDQLHPSDFFLVILPGDLNLPPLPFCSYLQHMGTSSLTGCYIKTTVNVTMSKMLRHIGNLLVWKVELWNAARIAGSISISSFRSATIFAFLHSINECTHC